MVFSSVTLCWAPLSTQSHSTVCPLLTVTVDGSAGTVPDYRSSPALQKSGIVWTDETLDKWLADPQAVVPGTKMFYALESAQDRADVIEFLKQKAGATP